MKRGSYARRACNHCRRRYVVVTLARRQIATNTEHAENQNVMATNQFAQPAEVLATKYAPLSWANIDVVLISLCIVLLGRRERKEAHDETICRLAEKDEPAVGPTKQVPRGPARVVHISSS
jgi:hypothetical protein